MLQEAVLGCPLRSPKHPGGCELGELCEGGLPVAEVRCLHAYSDRISLEWKIAIFDDGRQRSV